MDKRTDFMKYVTEFERTDYKGNKHTTYRYERGKVVAQSGSIKRLKEMIDNHKPPTEGTF
jgi:hypothetical protein